jgi:hypothetical protein
LGGHSISSAYSTFSDPEQEIAAPLQGERSKHSESIGSITDTF